MRDRKLGRIQVKQVLANFDSRTRLGLFIGGVAILAGLGLLLGFLVIQLVKVKPVARVEAITVSKIASVTNEPQTNPLATVTPIAKTPAVSALVVAQEATATPTNQPSLVVGFEGSPVAGSQAVAATSTPFSTISVEKVNTVASTKAEATPTPSTAATVEATEVPAIATATAEATEVPATATVLPATATVQPTATTAPPTVTATPAPANPTRKPTTVSKPVAQPTATFTTQPTATFTTQPTATFTTQPTATFTTQPTATAVPSTTIPATVTATNTAKPVQTAITTTATPNTATNSASLSLAVQYRTSSDKNKISEIRPEFVLVNQGSEAISLNEISLRYWYTGDGDQPQKFWCDYALLGCENLKGTFVKLDQPHKDADSYLLLTFGSGAGSLKGNSSSDEIKVRLSKEDWSEYQQNNDYSFDASKKNFANWQKVTIYRNGVLIWGTEPEVTRKS